MGYRVTLFEAMERPGGMMRYGIPAYRLAREVIDRQAAEIESMGVELRYSTPLTATFGVRELLADGFGAVFLAVGASRGRSVPDRKRRCGRRDQGDRLSPQHQSRLSRSTRQAKVVVVGGGLVAIDAARTAVRAMVPGLSISTADEQAVQGRHHARRARRRA
jgi:NADPH-dependent glutamate synthase beta subunit-like oxidoreductase